MIETLQVAFSHAFVQRALIVSVLVSLCASVLGVTLVLKRFSFIGDGLSHVAFGAIAIASVLQVSDQMLLVMPITMLSAVLLLRAGQSRKIKGDAAIAMISVGALAIGYLLMHIVSKPGNFTGDVCTTLFGATTIITLKSADVWLCVGASAFVVTAFILLYTKLFCVTFDEAFATATGTNAGAYNLIMALVIAIVIVMGMKLLGSLLISALVIFPALSAMRLFKSFLSVTICSACVSVVCAVAGLIVSIVTDWPVGATIVTVNVLVFCLFAAVGALCSRKLS